MIIALALAACTPVSQQASPPAPAFDAATVDAGLCTRALWHAEAAGCPPREEDCWDSYCAGLDAGVPACMIAAEPCRAIHDCDPEPRPCAL